MALFTPQYNLYSVISKIKGVLKVVFWIVFFLSLVPSILKLLKVQISFDDLLNNINIITLVIFFVLEIIVDYILIPQAESKRRDDFIDNAFGSTFTTNPSIGYFDTDEVQQGLYKAACNLFENSYFTYSLSKATTISKIIIPAIIFISILVFAYYGFKDVPFALSLLQVLFSVNLLGDLIKHFILLARLHFIHDEWLSLFQNQNFKSHTEQYRTYVFRYWLQYESLLSKIPADISNNIYKKLNPKLTQDWNMIKLRFNIN